MTDQGELDRIADELYALHPDGFAAARDERVKQARAEGRKELARELAGLRRPTMSAWIVNLLWRDQRSVVEQLIELADAMAHAQAQASGQALRTLMAQRREIEAALLRRAGALAEAAGVKVTPAMAREAQDTLAAAMARPDVAAELRTGRLVKPAAYAGFGDLAVMAPAPTMPASSDRAGVATEPRPAEGAATPNRAPAAPSPRPGPATSDADAASSQQPQVDELAERRAAAERAAAERAAAERRALAEARVGEARAALESAASALADVTRAAEAARDHHRQLLDLLRSLEDQVAAADAAAIAAADRRAEAEKARDAARRALAQAEQDAAAT